MQNEQIVFLQIRDPRGRRALCRFLGSRFYPYRPGSTRSQNIEVLFDTLLVARPSELGIFT